MDDSAKFANDQCRANCVQKSIINHPIVSFLWRVLECPLVRAAEEEEINDKKIIHSYLNNIDNNYL